MRRFEFKGKTWADACSELTCVVYIVVACRDRWLVQETAKVWVDTFLVVRSARVFHFWLFFRWNQLKYPCILSHHIVSAVLKCYIETACMCIFYLKDSFIRSCVLLCAGYIIRLFCALSAAFQQWTLYNLPP